MPIIAPHHKPGHFWPKDTEYSPTEAWPADTYVQWGGNGIVVGQSSYETAFFEAFPKSGGFIRGEGETIKEAEEQAFAQFTREHGCAHVIGRRGYTNGAGKCTKCGGFFSKSFAPVTELGAWRKGISHTSLSNIMSGWLRHRDGRERDNPDCARHSRRTFLKARTQGIDLPPTPEGAMTDDQFMGAVVDPYREACRETIARWLDAGGGAHLADWQRDSLLRSIEGHRRSDARLRAKAAGEG